MTSSTANDLTQNSGLRIDNMKALNCSGTGIAIFSAPGGVVINSIISGIGSSSISGAYGVYCAATGVVVQGCTITNVTASSRPNSYGMIFGAGNFATQNQISNAGIGIAGAIRQNNLTASCDTPFSAGTNGGDNVPPGS